MGSFVSQPHNGRFTAADLHETIKSTFVEQVEFDRIIDSTNNRALEIARRGQFQTPLLVLAERQTEGRGRGENTWWAQQGALTFSLLLRTDEVHLPPQLLPKASLTAGLAVCEAIEDFLDEPVRLKWPNDVYVRQRKICGILIELPPEQKQMVVIGVGVNVNNSVRDAPPELQSSAIALCDVARREFSLAELLLHVLVRLERRLQSVGLQDEQLRTSWRQRCMLTGRTIHLDSPTRSVVGLCRGIDDDGALLIETPEETERCFAGVVTRF